MRKTPSPISSTSATVKSSSAKKQPKPAANLPAASGVTLRIVAPLAKAVCVAGSFNDWKVGATPLKPARGGEWLGRIRLTAGRHEYLFVVDGHWLPDPAARESVPNAFGGLNSVISIG